MYYRKLGCLKSIKVERYIILRYTNKLIEHIRLNNLFYNMFDCLLIINYISHYYMINDNNIVDYGTIPQFP